MGRDTIFSKPRVGHNSAHANQHQAQRLCKGTMHRAPTTISPQNLQRHEYQNGP